MSKTKVIFRKFEGEIIALMPELPGDMSPATMTSYMHIGQHGAAGMQLVSRTKLATPDEYADLMAELVQIGYDVRVIKRQSAAMFDKRRQQLKNK